MRIFLTYWDFPLAVVEAKAGCKSATDAVQQARDYAEILGLKYAYATNGTEIIEIDYFKGAETQTSCRTRRKPDSRCATLCARR